MQIFRQYIPFAVANWIETIDFIYLLNVSRVTCFFGEAFDRL